MIKQQMNITTKHICIKRRIICCRGGIDGLIHDPEEKPFILLFFRSTQRGKKESSCNSG